MWSIVELAWEIVDLFLSWRLYLCLLIAVGLAVLIVRLFHGLDERAVGILLLVLGLLAGAVWEWKAHTR